MPPRLPRSFPMLVLGTTLVVGCAETAHTQTQDTTVTQPDTASPLSPASSPAAEERKLVVRVLLKVRTDQREAFIRYLEDETQKVKQLSGCERYALYRATGDDDSFLLYEEWASADAFAAYQSSDLLKQSFQVLGPMLAGPPESAYYAAEAVN